MSANEILSQDEVDALLHGMGSGDVGTEVEDSEDSEKARSYDLTNQDRIVRGRMPTLEMINERFARYFRISIFNMLRYTPEVSVGEVETVKFSEYMHGLFVPTNLNLIRIKGLRGTALIVMEPRLVFTLVDNFFGGDGRYYTRIEGREFTPTEMRVINKILELAFSDIREAWKPVMPVEIEYINSEVNPQFANIVSPNEVMVVTRFHVELDGGGGNFHITFPYSMIEPVRDLLIAGVQSDRADFDERWAKALREEMKQAKVEVRCTLAETEITLGDLLNSKVGDIIPISIEDSVVAHIADMPIFKCQYGIYHGINAVKIVDYLKRDQSKALTTI